MSTASLSVCVHVCMYVYVWVYVCQCACVCVSMCVIVCVVMAYRLSLGQHVDGIAVSYEVKLQIVVSMGAFAC